MFPSILKPCFQKCCVPFKSYSGPTCIEDIRKPYYSRYSLHKILACQCSISTNLGKAAWNQLNSHITCFPIAQDIEGHTRKYGIDDRIHPPRSRTMLVGDIAQKNKLGFKYTKVCNYSYVLLDASLIFSQILYHVQNETVHFTQFRDFDLIGQLYAFHRT